MSILSDTAQAYPHYFKRLPTGCTHVDVYRVLQLFEVTDPALQHAIKKLLCAGARGAKDRDQDVAEAIATLHRWQQMRLEEATPVTDFNLYTSPQPAPAAAPEDAERAAWFEQFATSEPQPVDFGPVPDPSLDRVAEAFRRKADRGHVTHPDAFTESDLLALQQWMLAWKSGDSHLGFEEWRAAYLARWKDAPKGATHLRENMYGGCWFHQESPILTEGLWLTTVGGETFAGGDLLGSVRCEPRPVQGVGP